MRLIVSDCATKPLVIFTSDNGPWNNMQDVLRRRHQGQIAWGSSGPLREGKGSTYEGGIRVPCIARWPKRIPAGRKSSAMMASIDFLPTLARLTGFKIPSDRTIDGVDQSDFLLGKTEVGKRRDYFYFCRGELHAVRQGDWKLRLPDRKQHYGYVDDKGSGKVELYNLKDDVGEQVNLAKEEPELVKQLTAKANRFSYPRTHYDPKINLPKTVFPKISAPVQLTSDDHEHFFASYYGINSFSADQKYATVLRTSVRNHLPGEDEPATLGLVEIESRKFIPLAQTRAWNFQQGCMAHWLGTNPHRHLIYNDLREGKFVSVILDVETKRELRVLPFPVSAVSPDGKKAVVINFSRLRKTRPDYGYGGNGQDGRLREAWPKDDGLFLADLESGQAKLLVSIASVKEDVPGIPEGGLEYFNHTLFSRDGSRIFWLARATPRRNTTAMTVRVDGTSPKSCFPAGWGGSHFDWLDDRHLMVTAKFQGKKFGHVLFDVEKQNYQALGKGKLDYDGHGTFSPDRKWMVTDTYPRGKDRNQFLYLMDMANQQVKQMAVFPQAEIYRGGWRCDLHPRWSPKGNLIGFNSTHRGKRQAYLIRLDSNSEKE